METRKLGRFEVTLAGLGCNNFGGRCDEQQTAAVVHAALDAGINFFDTADIYGAGGSEEFLGKALGARRDEVVIATKFGMPLGDDPTHKGGSTRWVARAVEGSLSRLGTDRIDLYQFHAPDPETPIEETLRTLDKLVQAGKVLEIGNSNFSGEQIAEADEVARARGLTRFVSAQNHYNLLHREIENDVLPSCEKLGLGLLPYFPLSSGFLTGKYRRDEDPPEGSRIGSAPAERRERVLSDENFTVLEQLEAFAAARGRSMLELAVSWLATQQPVVSVIAGATRPEQVKANAAALGWRLSPEEQAEVDTITG